MQYWFYYIMIFITNNNIKCKPGCCLKEENCMIKYQFAIIGWGGKWGPVHRLFRTRSLQDEINHRLNWYDGRAHVYHRSSICWPVSMGSDTQFAMASPDILFPMKPTFCYLFLYVFPGHCLWYRDDVMTLQRPLPSCLITAPVDSPHKKIGNAALWYCLCW